MLLAKAKVLPLQAREPRFPVRIVLILLLAKALIIL
jgi:hypothetical protein